jgi:ABC-type uncharacterized transport system ATPase subunit
MLVGGLPGRRGLVDEVEVLRAMEELGRLKGMLRRHPSASVDGHFMTGEV